MKTRGSLHTDLVPSTFHTLFAESIPSHARSYAPNVVAYPIKVYPPLVIYYRQLYFKWPKLVERSPYNAVKKWHPRIFYNMTVTSLLMNWANDMRFSSSMENEEAFYIYPIELARAHWRRQKLQRLSLQLRVCIVCRTMYDMTVPLITIIAISK